MKKSLRYFILLTLCIALVCMAAACGADEPAPAPAPEPEPAEETPAEVVEEPTTGADQFDTDWPTKDINIVTAGGAGGGSDTTCRIVAQCMEEVLGVTVTVTNMPGNNGWVSLEYVAASEPDGYTIGGIACPNMMSAMIDPQQEYSLDNLEDYTWLACLDEDASVLYIRSDEDRFTTIEELIAYAKENELTCTGNGIGSDDHIAGLLFGQAVGIETTCVHYSSAGDMAPAVLGGHVDIGFDNLGTVYNFYESGDIKVLCVFSEQRFEDYMPEVPTFNELGLSDKSVTNASYRGFYFPAGVDQVIIDKMIWAMHETFESEQCIELHKNAGIPINPTYREDYEAMMMRIYDDVESLAEFLVVE